MTLDAVPGHPGLAEGITDDQTPVIAALWRVHRHNRDLVEVLLDPGNVSIESRRIDRPETGSVDLHILRLGLGGNPETMDHVAAAVGSIEASMSLPLPTDMVTVLFADAAGYDQGATNAGTAIIIHPEFEHDPDLLTGVLAHEVAHYYWRGNKDWLDEGIAEIIQTYQQRETNGSEMTLSHPRAGRRRASGNWRPST